MTRGRVLVAAGLALVVLGAAALIWWGWRDEHDFRQRCSTAGGTFHEKLTRIDIIATGKGQSTQIDHYRWSCVRAGRELFHENT